jgi:hypothetical protein
MHVVDHESFGSNETGSANATSSVTITNDNPMEILPGFIGKAGGEVRVEVQLKASATNIGDILVTGKVFLFEGTSDTSSDLDGQADVNLIVPKDSVRRWAVHVDNQNEGGDYADIEFTFNNRAV